MRIDRLSNLDRLMIGASRTWPQDIGAMVILDGRELCDPAGHLRIEALRQSIESRLHLVPRFRQLIFTPGRWQGGPFWMDDPDFDLSEHVREQTLPPPGGERQLLEAIEQIRKRRLDPGRPLWEMWFLTGMPAEKVGLYVRIHHAVADGIAAMTTVAAFLDTSADPPAVPAVSWTPEPAPSSRDLFTDNLARRLGSLANLLTALLHPGVTVRRIRTAWPAIGELVAESPSTETSLDQMVGPDRHLALIRERLDVAKAVGHAHGATVNDILLASTAGGLRALLRSRGEAVEDTTLRAYAPVSLRRERHRPQQGNLIAQMAIPLPLGGADPFRRLRQIATESSERKARARTSLGILIHGRITRRIMLMAVMRQRVNLTTASIPGPTEPLYLLGARLLEVFPILPLIANEPLAVGALSYAGALNIGIVADRDAVPDLEVFTAGVGAELEALGAPPIPAGDALMSGPLITNERSQ